MEAILKRLIYAEAVENVLKAKAKRYEKLATLCKKSAEHMRDYRAYDINVGRVYHHKNTTDLYQDIKQEEASDLLTKDIIKMLMDRHEQLINEAMGAAQKIQDDEERGAMIEEICEALKALPEIENIYMEFCSESGTEEDEEDSDEDYII